MKVVRNSLCLVLLCVSVISCGGNQLPPGVDADTVAAKISQTKDLAVFTQALEDADLLELLNSGDYTVFAPSDAAFTTYGSLPQGDDLDKLLYYHIVNEIFDETQLRASPLELETVEGSTITATVADGKVVLNGEATLTQTDITGSNGVVHIIDTVIVPPASAN